MWAFSSSHCIFSAVDLWLKFPKKDMLQLQPEARVSEFPSFWQTKLENSFWLGVASIKRLASKSIDNGPLSAYESIHRSAKSRIRRVRPCYHRRSVAKQFIKGLAKIFANCQSCRLSFLAISSLEARTGFPERTTKCPLNYHRNSIIARDAKRSEGCS